MHRIISLKGMREYMEDRHQVIENFYDGYELYMVCDGHGGDFVADYCILHIPIVLKGMLESGMEIPKALVNTFHSIDESLDRPSSFMTGTTCLVILKSIDHAWIANCGDSRAILNSKEGVSPLSIDHKPIGKEKQRIESMGGYVLPVGPLWRVCGELAVSRAIGDKKYDPYVTARPDIYKCTFLPENKFFVLATDGLWDLLRIYEVNEIVYNKYKIGEYSDQQVLDAACKDLLARIRNPEDNTTIIIVHLRR
jgi:serine/threonine protein phosphatase PrpC